MILGKSLDYESDIQSYDLIVRVADESSASLVTINCAVTPVNEDDPIIVAGGVANVREDESTGSVIGGVQASDADYAPHGISNYYFVGMCT